MKKKSLPLSEAYRLLEPGPVVMVSTCLKNEANVMTLSWHMMIDFVPPLVGCIMSDQHYSFHLLQKSKECVINIPTVELAEKVVGVGNTSGRNVDKFERFSLLQEPASCVSAPLLSECYANLECKVVDTRLVTKYGLFILQVVKAWIRSSKRRARTIHHCGNGVFVVDGKVLTLPSKMK